MIIIDVSRSTKNRWPIAQSTDPADSKSIREDKILKSRKFLRALASEAKWNDEPILTRPLFGDLAPAETILESQIVAARMFLEAVESELTRVGVIAFSGGPPGSPWKNPFGTTRSSWTEVPLTNDFPGNISALTAIHERPLTGLSDIAEAIDRGWVELTGMKEAQSRARPDSRKMLLLFTDGMPTLPYEYTFLSENLRVIARALDRARRMSVEVHLFSLGPYAEALRVVEPAVAATGGAFHPIVHRSGLLPAVQSLACKLSAEVGPNGPTRLEEGSGSDGRKNR